MEIDIRKYFTYSDDAPVFFTSVFFWILLGLSILFYSLVYKKPALRHAYLLLISLYFYYMAGGWFFLMLIFSTLADYFLGIRIHLSKSKFQRKIFLVCSLLINLGILGYFKYAYFITDIFSQITGNELQVTNVFNSLLNKTIGAGADIHTILLPVGISFYTFQTISYTVDVYRKHVNPVKNIIDFGFYVSFFPQLVAGPIVRAADFIPQLSQKYSLTEKQFWHSVFLILGGLVKKILVADYLAAGLVDRVFESPLSYSGFENLFSLYAYSIQIYFDFSGYTDIAIGVALLLGFRLPVNFNAPYQAKSLTDFWRRWHISLSSWLRDYLYIPMGGNRKGKTRTIINLMLTMIIGGLWHGAHLRFVLWGLYHGLILTVEKVFTMRFPKISRGRWRNLMSRIFCFHLIMIGWLIFRAETPRVAVDMFSQVFKEFQIGVVPQFIAAQPYIIIDLY